MIWLHHWTELDRLHGNIDRNPWDMLEGESISGILFPMFSNRSIGNEFLNKLLQNDDYLFWTMTSWSSWENQCTFDTMESSARKNNQLISTSNSSSKQSYMKHLYIKQSQLTKDITGERLSCVVKKNYHKRNWNRTKAVHWQRHVNRLDTVFLFVETVNWA